MRLKIVYIGTEDMLNKRGGGTTHFFELAEAFAKFNCSLLMILPFYRSSNLNNNIVSLLSQYGIQLRKVPTFRKSIIAFGLFQILLIPSLIYSICKFKPDIIYLRAGYFDLFISVISKIFNVPLFLEINGIAVEELKANAFHPIIIGIFNFFHRITLELSSNIICVSNGIADKLCRMYKISCSKFAVVPNEVNITLFKPMEKQKAAAEINLDKNFRDKFLVGFVGTITPWHGVDALIKAAEIIKDKGFRSIGFLIVGEGKIRKKLEAVALREGLNDIVKFTGSIPYNQVPYYINVCDLMIIPISSKMDVDISPLKLKEYMSCGKPIVATRLKGVKEIIEESSCGFLCNPDDPYDLAYAIIQAFLKKDRIKEIGLRGRRFLISQGFTWENAAKKILKRIEKIKLKK